MAKPLSSLPLPARTVPISPELELRVSAIEDPAQPGTGEPAFGPTAAGFRLSPAQAEGAAEALQVLARRAAEMALWAPEA